MNIRKKTILTIIHATITIVLVGGILAYTIFLRSYKDLEKMDILADVNHLESTLDRELDNLTAITNDWAAWDDTYRYMKDKNPEYLASNLVDGTFDSLGLNLFIIFELDSNIAYIKAYDLEEQEEIEPSNNVIQIITETPQFFQIDEDEISNGFISSEILQ